MVTRSSDWDTKRKLVSEGNGKYGIGPEVSQHPKGTKHMHQQFINVWELVNLVILLMAKVISVLVLLARYSSIPTKDG